MIDERKIQLLLDKQEIYELLCRYCRGIDRLDKELVLSCFHPGATDIHVGVGSNAVHTGSIEEFLDKEWDSWKRYAGSQHHLCNHLCEVIDDVALAETYQFSFYWAEPGDDLEFNVVNSNRYIDRFERRNSEWRIAHRELYRNFVRRETRPFVFPTKANGWPRGSQDRSDPAYRTLARD